jgi:hypothetical protein
VNSVRAVRYHVGDVHYALVERADTTSEPQCKSEALTLAKLPKDFKYLVTLADWCDLLTHVNIANKIGHNQSMNINQAFNILWNTNQLMTDHREYGFCYSLTAEKSFKGAGDV